MNRSLFIRYYFAQGANSAIDLALGVGITRADIAEWLREIGHG